MIQISAASRATLIEQLKPGERMVIPVGMTCSHQELMLLTKQYGGSSSIEPILAVAVVPLVISDDDIESTRQSANKQDSE